MNFYMSLRELNSKTSSPIFVHCMFLNWICLFLLLIIFGKKWIFKIRLIFNFDNLIIVFQFCIVTIRILMFDVKITSVKTRSEWHMSKDLAPPAPHTMLTYANFFAPPVKMSIFFKNQKKKVENYDLWKSSFRQIRGVCALLMSLKISLLSFFKHENRTANTIFLENYQI